MAERGSLVRTERERNDDAQEVVSQIQTTAASKNNTNDNQFHALIR